MRGIFALVLILLAPYIYAASTYLNFVDEYTIRFETTESDLQPFASTMIYKWQSVSTSIKFNLDSAGSDLYFDSFLVLYDPPNNYFSFQRIKADNIDIQLDGVVWGSLKNNLRGETKLQRKQ